MEFQVPVHIIESEEEWAVSSLNREKTTKSSEYKQESYVTARMK